MSTVRISRRAAQALLEVGREQFTMHGPFHLAIQELESALKPKTKKAWATLKRDKLAKKATRKEETSTIRAAVMSRANGRCEACGLEQTFGTDLQMDHFWGRGKARQTVENCWAIGRYCHSQKTDNHPSAEHWLHRFAEHARKHHYWKEVTRANERMHFVLMRKHLGAELHSAAPANPPAPLAGSDLEPERKESGADFSEFGEI